MMSKHFLQAYINKIEGPRFRIVCEDPETCRKTEGNERGCIYRRDFILTGQIDMVGWPKDTEQVMGEVELRHVLSEPSSYYEQLAGLISLSEDKRLEDTQQWNRDEELAEDV
jgi:hypothetical protein